MLGSIDQRSKLGRRDMAIIGMFFQDGYVDRHGSSAIGDDSVGPLLVPYE